MKLDTLNDAKAEMKKRVGETEYYFAIVLKEKMCIRDRCKTSDYNILSEIRNLLDR